MPEPASHSVNTDHVHIVEDDPLLRDMLTDVLIAHGFQTKAFSSASQLLENEHLDQAGCVVSDIRMPGMSGLELQQQLSATLPYLPVILITGYGEVSTAVQALKNGAFDFLEKPVTPVQLVERVRDALAYAAQHRHIQTTRETLADRFSRLTARELEILAEIVAGKVTKETARNLDISVRTVEHHRAHIIEKIEVSGINELIHLYARWQLMEAQL